MKNIILTIALIAILPVAAFADAPREFNQDTFDASLTWSTASLSCALKKMDNMTAQQKNDIIKYIDGMSENGIKNGAFTIHAGLLGAISIFVCNDVSPYELSEQFVRAIFECHNDRVKEKQNSAQKSITQENFNMDKQTGVNPDGVADAQVAFEQSFAHKCVPGRGLLNSPGNPYSQAYKGSTVTVDHSETTCTPRAQNRYDCVTWRYFTDGHRCKIECTDWRATRGDSRNISGFCSFDSIY